MEANPNRFAAEPRNSNSISPHNPEFRQLHQLLLYARLARHWTKLVDLSYNTASDASKYMRMAKQHNITLKQRWDVLISGSLVWALHKVTQKNGKEFNWLRVNLRYHFDVGRLVRCVRKDWGTVLLPATQWLDTNHIHIRNSLHDCRTK